MDDEMSAKTIWRGRTFDIYECYIICPQKVLRRFIHRKILYHLLMHFTNALQSHLIKIFF